MGKQDELLEIESSQRQHHEALQHYEKMLVEAERLVLTRFSMLKPSIIRDGDQWCVLYGKDLQEGIAGFGNTPIQAIANWNKALDTPIAVTDKP